MVTLGEGRGGVRVSDGNVCACTWTVHDVLELQVKEEECMTGGNVCVHVSWLLIDCWVKERRLHIVPGGP